MTTENVYDWTDADKFGTGSSDRINFIVDNELSSYYSIDPITFSWQTTDDPLLQVIKSGGAIHQVMPNDQLNRQLSTS
ncbi:hypothetical protein, partial [Staphylococcus aureus]